MKGTSGSPKFVFFITPIVEWTAILKTTDANQEKSVYVYWLYPEWAVIFSRWLQAILKQLFVLSSKSYLDEFASIFDINGIIIYIEHYLVFAIRILSK